MMEGIAQTMLQFTLQQIEHLVAVGMKVTGILLSRVNLNIPECLLGIGEHRAVAHPLHIAPRSAILHMMIHGDDRIASPYPGIPRAHPFLLSIAAPLGPTTSVRTGR